MESKANIKGTFWAIHLIVSSITWANQTLYIKGFQNKALPATFVNSNSDAYFGRRSSNASQVLFWFFSEVKSHC